MPKLNYLWTIPLGVYPYLVFQLLSLLRFGQVKQGFDPLDWYLLLVGLLSSLLLFFYLNKTKKPKPRKTMVGAFIVGVIFSSFGMLFGGLIGGVGIVVYGMIPFFIALPVGYRMAREDL